jgi:hypothetical protein
MNRMDWKGTEMKTSTRVVMLLVVLGLSLPGYGEILVYKATQSGTFYRLKGGEWRIQKESGKGYVVIEMNYGDTSITQAVAISYWKTADGKFFRQSLLSPDMSLARVAYDNKVEWGMVRGVVERDGETITGGSLAILTGEAYTRGIGVYEKREVANKLTGYGLEDFTRDGGDRDIADITVSLTWYPAWTSWANDMNRGNQVFTAATGMITQYLIRKGYTEETE